ncbi:hypothetical protein CHS0354_035388 [Potamilus streckersoni]|uniref:Uncharacterized protein n=1 Tax=Potamilus streckersoni TaxID=2493646 RepID=A0AAE0TDH6_9BIVA|nr:hypothetical protein CHS0354_035388 [Potamilus streckersoni]
MNMHEKLADIGTLLEETAELSEEIMALRLGTVTCHVNLLREYMRTVLMATLVNENNGVDINFPPRAGQGYVDVKLKVNWTKEQREDTRNLCNKFQDVLN